MDSGFTAVGGDALTTVANGWFAWHEETAKAPDANYVFRPDWHAATNSADVHGGSAAQHIANQYDPFHAGIFQTVTVAAGSRVRLTAYGRVFSSNDGYPNNDSGIDSRLQVGIDPNGNGLWFDSGIVWSGIANPHMTWQLLSVEATVGAAGKVSVYLSSNWRGNSNLNMLVWWDDVSLTVVSSATAAATSGATSAAPPPAPATAFPTPTAGADGRIVYTVQAGDSLWHIAAVAGLTVDELKALNNLTSDVVSPGQQLVLGTTEPAVPPTPVATATTEGDVAAATPTPVVEAVATGTICVLLYEDVNGNSLRDSGEGSIAGGQFTLTNSGGAPADAYTTTGTESAPHCFESLAADSYTVSVGIPAGYNATGSTSVPIPLSADGRVNVEFGAQRAGSTSLGSEEASDKARMRTALFGAAGVVFLLSAAGVAGYLALSRRS